MDLLLFSIDNNDKNQKWPVFAYIENDRQKYNESNRFVHNNAASEETKRFTDGKYISPSTNRCIAYMQPKTLLFGIEKKNSELYLSEVVQQNL